MRDFLKNDGQFGHGEVDTRCQQITGCVYATGSAFDFGSASNRRSRGAKCGKEFRFRKFRGEVNIFFYLNFWLTK